MRRPATRRPRFLVLFAAGIAAPVRAQPHDVHLVTREKSLGPRRPGIVEHTLSVSAAQRLANVIKVPQGEAVVVDGKQHAMYTAIPRVRLSEAGITAPLLFSPDGARIAYVAVKNGRSVVVIDGADGPSFDRIAVGAPAFSPDGRHVAYVAEREGTERVVVDGIEGQAYDQIDRIKPGFAADTRHVFYSARRADRGYVVVDGHESAGADFVGDVTVDDASGRVAYAVKRGDRAWSIVVDGVEGKAYTDIGNNLVFSRDGRRFLYRAGDMQDHVVVDGVEGAGFGSITENSYEFSDDGLHVAFAALDRSGRFWVLDGTRGESFEWVSTEPAFSPDGRRLTYVAEEARKRFVVIGDRRGPLFDDIVVVDGVESLAYDEIVLLSPPTAAAPRSLRLLARRGTVDFRVTIEWTEPTSTGNR